jgi:hypothetical protein
MNRPDPKPAVPLTLADAEWVVVNVGQHMYVQIGSSQPEYVGSK